MIIYLKPAKKDSTLGNLVGSEALKPRREYDVHDIIKYYPYFLGSTFARMHIIHERVYPNRTRADFTFSNKERISVIEVKKGFVDMEMLEQALAYLNEEKQQSQGKKLEGVLVGLPICDPDLTARIDGCGYPFLLKFINIDIPASATQIKICEENICRKANWQYRTTCDYCGSRKFINDPFTFTKKRL